MSDTDPVYKDFQASIARYAMLALATMEMLERVFGRDAVNAALAGHRDYEGLIALIHKVGVGENDR